MSREKILIKTKFLRYVNIIFRILLIFLMPSFIAAYGYCASISGKITDAQSSTPINNAAIVIDNLISYSDSNGNYHIDNIQNTGTYLITATAEHHSDFGERITISSGPNTKNINLINTGEYSGDADSEYVVTISNPASGYAHVKCIYKEVTPNETVKLNMHYVYDDFLLIENIKVVDNLGASLQFIFNVRKEDFYWYELTVENTANTTLIIEYDIHYVTICHNGNTDCYHGYISDTYGIFENMNHILFAGASGYDLNGPKTAVRFILPAGWVAVTPWVKVGNYYIGNTADILFASPGVGRFELNRLIVNGYNVVLGIHESANEFAPIADEWPITIKSFERGIAAANQINSFESNRSIVVGIPPLGANEGGVNSVYSSADNFPASFWNLGGMDDIQWCDGHWTQLVLEYFGDIILYTSGFYSKSQYEQSINDDKAIYLNQIFGTSNDIPVADLEHVFSPDGVIKTVKTLKSKLFTYLLDFEIHRVTNNAISISDVFLFWRHNLDHNDWSNLDALSLLNDYIGHDFSDFFNSYFFGNEKLPVDVQWYYSSLHPSADAGQDQTKNEKQRVVISASSSNDPNGDILSYKWRQINGPIVTLDDDTAISPSFIAPSISDPAIQSIQIDFELKITYLENLWDSDDVSIMVKNIDDPHGGTVKSLLFIPLLLLNE